MAQISFLWAGITLMEFTELLALAALFLMSLVANTFSAFVGGGTGLLQLPMLIFLGLPFSVALATHKFATLALGVGATLRHMRTSRLERHFVALMLLCGLPGVLLGTQLIVHVPGRIAEISLGVLTLGLGVYSIFSPNLGQQHEPTNRQAKGYAIGGAVLFLLGVLNGSLTSGSGLFVSIWLVRWFGLDYSRAVAYTLILVGMFWNGTGALALGMLTEIRWDWMPVLLAGSFLGGYLGAHLAILKGNRAIKRSYEVVTVLVGTLLIIG